MPSPLSRFKRRKAPTKHRLDVNKANVLSMQQIADVLGMSYELQGRHIELENGMRGTSKDDKPVWCHEDGAGIGDNAALVMSVTGKDFRAALELMLGHNPTPTSQSAPKPLRRALRLPYSAFENEGRQYLIGRGFSPEAIEAAERCGMLRYARSCVLFVGYDGSEAKSATRRGYGENETEPKRDLSGSDKQFAPVLVGSNPGLVWVVEGGADALALWTLYPQGRWPTVIISGGANCRAFIETKKTQEILAKAGEIIVSCDVEDDLETQAKTDALHAKQVELLQGYCSNVRLWRPTSGAKDLGDEVLKRLESKATINNKKENHVCN